MEWVDNLPGLVVMLYYTLYGTRASLTSI